MVVTFFNNNEKSSKCAIIDDYIDCVISVNDKWESIFEMICVSIISRVRIISITNIYCVFMVSDSLSLLNTYQIVNDNSVMSNMYIYLYCRLYKALTTPSASFCIS